MDMKLLVVGAAAAAYYLHNTKQSIADPVPQKTNETALKVLTESPRLGFALGGIYGLIFGAVILSQFSKERKGKNLLKIAIPIITTATLAFVGSALQTALIHQLKVT